MDLSGTYLFVHSGRSKYLEGQLSFKEEDFTSIGAENWGEGGPLVPPALRCHL